MTAGSLERSLIKNHVFMKTILVDAINTLIIKDSGLFLDMFEMLESFSNRKIILSSADDEQMEKFGLNKMPYEVFTLKHNPEKSDPNYYKKMLEYFGLSVDEVIYFEHNEDAVKSARSVGIETFHYNKDSQDLVSLKRFLMANL